VYSPPSTTGATWPDQQRARRWQRREFIAGRFDALEASPAAKAVMRLLDYNATRVTLPGADRRRDQ
jgi:hypothetical protein